MRDPTLPYLVHRIAARIEASVNNRTRRHGLRLQGFRVLRRLWERDGQRLGELAEQTSIEASTLSHLVSRMVRDGWLRKSRMTDDDRSISINLTEAGREIAAELVPMLEHYDTVCLAGFTTAEKNSIKTALQKIYDNLEDLESAIDAWERRRSTR